MELNPEEQRLLNETAMALAKAERELQEHERLLDESRHRMTEGRGVLRGAMGAVLRLRGLNPDEYTARWDQKTESVVVERNTGERSPNPQ